MSNAAATLSLGVSTARARNELNELVTALKSFKGELHAINAMKGSNPLQGLSAHSKSELDLVRAQMRTMGAEHEVALKKLEEQVTTSHSRRLKETESFNKKALEQKRQYEQYMNTSHLADTRTTGLMQLRAVEEDIKRAKALAAQSASIGPTREMFERSNAEMAKAHAAAIREDEVRTKNAQAKSLEINQAGYRQVEIAAREHAQKMQALNLAGARAQEIAGLKAAAAVGPTRDMWVQAQGAANLAAETERVKKAHLSATGATKTHAEAMRDAHSAARGLAAGFNSMWLTWGNVAPLIAGFAISAGVRAAIEGFAKVEYQMTFVKSLTEDTTTSVAGLSKAMHGVALELGISPEKASEGLRQLAQAGLTTSEAMRSLPAVFKLATVGELSVGDAAITATSAMNAFGMGSNQIEKIGDVLAKAGAMSATSVSSMAQSMKYASTIAQQYEITIEEVGLGLTAMAKRGIVGTMAGTSFKNMLNELAAPQSQKAKDLIKQLGIEVFDATGKFKPLIEQVEQMRGAMSKFDRPSQLRILRDIFGERGDRAFGALLAQSRGQLESWQGQLQSSMGFTAEVFRNLQMTTKGQFDLMAAQVSNTFAEIGESSSGALIDMMQQIRSAFASDAMRSAIKGLTQSVATLLELVVKYGPYVAAFWAAWSMSSVVSVGVTALGRAVGGLSVALGGLSARPVLALLAALNPYARLASIVFTVAGGFWLLAERHDSLGVRLARDTKSVVGMSEALEKENAQLEKKNDLMRRGVSSANLEAELNLMEKKSNLDQARVRIEQIQMSRSGRLAAEGDFSTTGAKQARDELAELGTAVSNAEVEVSHLEKLTGRRRQLLKEAEALNKAEIDKQTAAFRKNQPTGAKTYNGLDRGQPGEFSADKADMVEYYRNAERLAKSAYETDIAIANAMKSEKLSSQDQFMQLRWEAEAKYRVALEDAEFQSFKKVLGLKDAATSQAQLKQLDTELKKQGNRADEQAAADRENQRKVNELASIKAQGAAAKVINEEVPALEAKTRLDAENLEITRQRIGMSEMDIAALSARTEVNNRYNSAIEKQSAKLEELRNATPDDIKAISATEGAIAKLTEARRKDANYAADQAKINYMASNTFEMGAKDAFAEYEKSAGTAASNTKSLFTKAFSGMEDALVKFVKTGKLEWKDLANSIIDELIRIQIKQMLVQATGGSSGSGWLGALVGVVGSYFGSTGGAGSMSSGGSVQGNSSYVYDLHSGGIVGSGEGSGLNLRSMSLFDDARRMHTGGIVGNEEPIIAQKGEGVFTPAQMQAMGGDTYSISISVQDGQSSNSESGSGSGGKGKELARQLEAAVMQILAREKRSGGVMA